MYSSMIRGITSFAYIYTQELLFQQNVVAKAYPCQVYLETRKLKGSGSSCRRQSVKSTQKQQNASYGQSTQNTKLSQNQSSEFKEEKIKVAQDVQSVQNIQSAQLSQTIQTCIQEKSNFENLNTQEPIIQQTEKEIEEQFQKEVKICLFHNLPFIKYCCKEQELICQKCQEEDHQIHKTDNIENQKEACIYNFQQKLKLFQSKKELTTQNVNQLQAMQQQLNVLQQKITQSLSKLYEEEMKKMQEKTQRTVKYVNEWIQDFSNAINRVLFSWKQIDDEKYPNDIYQIVRVINHVEYLLDKEQKDKKETLKKLSNIGNISQWETLNGFVRSIENNMEQLRLELVQQKFPLQKKNLDIAQIDQETALNIPQTLLFSEQANRKIVKFRNDLKKVQSSFEIPTADFTRAHRSLQVESKSLIISGGQNQWKRFIFVDNQEAKTYETLHERQSHALAYEKGKAVFLIAGEYAQKKCEIFKFSLNNFNEIDSLPIDIRGHSSAYLNQQLYNLGGFSNQQEELIDDIYYYSNQLNK